jgi:tyrosyl-DNA phosphodiesterase-1
MTRGTSFAEFLLPTTPFAPNGLTHAVLATYCADIPWLARMFPKGPAKTHGDVTFICLEQGDLKPGVYSPMHTSMPNWVQLVVPKKGLGEYTTMHMKFLLLFYEDRLRLVILSGNMVEYDWKAIENTAFIHDFPRLAKGHYDVTSEYGIQMKAVLASLSVPAGHPAMRLLSSYNMASTCEARIVSSQPTLKPITGWSEIEKLGLGRLSKIVREIMKGAKKQDMTVEAQVSIAIKCSLVFEMLMTSSKGSSMGTYSTRWLQQFHLICCGLNIDTLLPLPNGAKANKTWAQAVSRKDTEKWPPIKLLFPSDRWVKTQSIGGPDGAMTFFGKSKQAVEKGFVDIIYQPVSIRGNIMMHHKAILALPTSFKKEQDEHEVLGWAYMGSHNLTQAAWGNLSQAKAGGETQCTIGNWELGIVVPIRQKDLDESQQKGESQCMGANIVTWQRPVEKYRAGDIPWDQFNQ